MLYGAYTVSKMMDVYLSVYTFFAEIVMTQTSQWIPAWRITTAQIWKHTIKNLV